MIRLTEAQIDEIQRVSECDDVRREYSGKFMYGARCVGVVGRPGDLMRFSLALAHVLGDPKLATTLADTMRQDDMGLSYIYYWPEIICMDEWVDPPTS